MLDGGSCETCWHPVVGSVVGGLVDVRGSFVWAFSAVLERLPEAPSSRRDRVPWGLCCCPSESFLVLGRTRRCPGGGAQGWAEGVFRLGGETKRAVLVGAKVPCSRIQSLWPGMGSKVSR